MELEKVLNKKNTEFAKETIEGLSRKRKKLFSKFIYDEKGDAFFRQIMNLPSYYLTRSEYEILETRKEIILEYFKGQSGHFHLVEFGAGDGLKTKVLLKHFLEQEVSFDYCPIDISSNILNILETSLKTELPDLKVRALHNDYFGALDALKATNPGRIAGLFLGSNIGNFEFDQAVKFMTELGKHLSKGDIFMTGFDLKKEPNIIIKAYNDAEGVTKAFNFNLLHRMNRELGANFDLGAFQHYPYYNPVSGAMRSYLISLKKQKVVFERLGGVAIDFEYAEPIDVEISKKYCKEEIAALAEASGFRVLDNLYDCKHYFTDSIWEKK